MPGATATPTPRRCLRQSSGSKTRSRVIARSRPIRACGSNCSKWRAPSRRRVPRSPSGARTRRFTQPSRRAPQRSSLTSPAPPSGCVTSPGPCVPAASSSAPPNRSSRSRSRFCQPLRCASPATAAPKNSARCCSISNTASIACWTATWRRPRRQPTTTERSSPRRGPTAVIMMRKTRQPRRLRMTRRLKAPNPSWLRTQRPRSALSLRRRTRYPRLPSRPSRRLQQPMPRMERRRHRGRMSPTSRRRLLKSRNCGSSASNSSLSP